MQESPHMIMKKSLLEKMLTAVTFAALLGVFLYLGLIWHSLPKEIPVHFGINGKPDSWGQTGMIWVLPVIGLLLSIVFTALEAFPNIYNFPVPITESNAEKQYNNARMLLCLLKTEISLFFVYETWQSAQIAYGAKHSLGLWNIPVLFIVVFGTIGISIYRSIKAK
ncbi:DUF1648 domain-containing protein [Metabacillus sp. RGM 3146]|uniref:DUF1648 domain-containing protein n=1 Tax=Metabacillus sp. RGM 3146 TaxID=3401092 RepID=UPI003B9BDD1C